MSTQPTIGERLRQAREKQGLSKRKAAERLGISDQMLKLWELNVSTPGWDRAGPIAEFIDEDRYDVLVMLGCITAPEAAALKAATLAGAIRGSSGGVGLELVGVPPRARASLTASSSPRVDNHDAAWWTGAHDPRRWHDARCDRGGDAIGVRPRGPSARPRLRRAHRQRILQVGTPARTLG